MIDVQGIRDIIKEIAVKTGLVWIRGDQVGPAPPYPYGMYTMVTVNNDAPHQSRVKREFNSVDETKVDIKKNHSYKAMVSLNFLDRSKPDVPYDKAKTLWSYFDSVEGKEFVKSKGFIARFLSPDIANRSTLHENFYEYRIGFDVRFDSEVELVDTTERISTIDIKINNESESLQVVP